MLRYDLARVTDNAPSNFRSRYFQISYLLLIDGILLQLKCDEHCHTVVWGTMSCCTLLFTTIARRPRDRTKIMWWEISCSIEPMSGDHRELINIWQVYWANLRQASNDLDCMPEVTRQRVWWADHWISDRLYEGSLKVPGGASVSRVIIVLKNEIPDLYRNIAL